MKTLKIKYLFWLQLCFSAYFTVEQASGDVSLEDDPALFPGHLQPLATGRPIRKVEQVDGFPEPDEFFTKYVKTNPKKAVIFKGGAKLSPAYHIWSDDYLKNHPESEKMEFDVEIGKKEDRKGNMAKRTVKDFINAYHTEDIYAVSDVPIQLKNQFLLPPVLRCNNIKDRLSMMLMWFSSGHTKSVLHHDSFENINCLYRGSKRLLLAEHPKYKSKVVLDRPNGYSAVDVDKVDFTKYPGLREVEYWEANMEQGDCLYIPYSWYHQVNSFPNENKTNIAVNVWWFYDAAYSPKDCTMKPEEATLEKFKFEDADSKAYGAGSKDQSTDVIGIALGYFNEKNTDIIKYEEFLEDLQKDNNSLSDLGVFEIGNKKRRAQFAKELYAAIDVDGSGVVDFNDFNALEDGGVKTQKNLKKVSKKLDKYFEWLDKKKGKGTQEDTKEGDSESTNQNIKEEL